MPESRRGLTLLMLLVLLVGVGWLIATRVVDTEQAGLPPAPQVGHPAPDFALATLDGETLTLSQLKGRPVLLNFWATWCPPCQAEMPHIQAAHDEYHEAGLVIVALDQLETADRVRQFADEFGLTFPLGLDPTGEVGVTYQVRALPTSFFIDRQGFVAQKFTGPMTPPILEEHLHDIMR